MTSQRVLLCVALTVVAACAKKEVEDPYPDQRELCAQRNALRNVYYGDLHIHSRLSFDAWAHDVRLAPDDAYRFARGEEVALPPLDENGQGTRKVRLRRPLDFAAVTDHSEFLGEVSLCLRESSDAYPTSSCSNFRGGGVKAISQLAIGVTVSYADRNPEVCGDDGMKCLTEATSTWRLIQTAAENAYDRTSACSFTSFVAYEYSNTPSVSGMHRNVIFRNANVPELPISKYEARTPEDLWRQLKEQCLDASSSCDVLAIPHNSNQSNGQMFRAEYDGAKTVEQERLVATSRARLEPLVEIFQHKGDSECINGLAGIGPPDELCDFEKLRAPPLEDCLEGKGSGGQAGFGCVSRHDYVRTALKTGLEEEARLGVNPLKLGIIASTDTHNATPGNVDEREFPGHVGTAEDTAEKRLSSGGDGQSGYFYNPGGLAAVWAEDRSRNAIFDALKRRETFGTSGPRIAVRFFGGWSYDHNLCDDPKLLEAAYGKGVPMGSDLPAERSGGAPPVFIAYALMDPGTSDRPGTPLQRMQLVKGWINSAGKSQEKVFELAGDVNHGASVDLRTCETKGEGFNSLCTVWTDPEFDSTSRAFYYLRVVENPTCRWSTYQCNALDQPRPAACDDPNVPRTIQERAWTSPIWYTPPL
jgi:hypothetical protein